MQQPTVDGALRPILEPDGRDIPGGIYIPGIGAVEPFSHGPARLELHSPCGTAEAQGTYMVCTTPPCRSAPCMFGRESGPLISPRWPGDGARSRNPLYLEVAVFSKKSITVQIEANITWKVARDPDSGDWVGVCDALNLNAIGDTWADFQECANEAIELLFQDLFREGELDQFLLEHGWRPMTALPEPGRNVRFDVPNHTTIASSVDDLVSVQA